MCGIVAIAKRETNRDSMEGLLKKVESAQSHRGPDSQGTYLNEITPGRYVGLGHQRLSILDLTKAGHQPMQSLCGRYFLTFNGEIYNYLELAEQLQKNPLRNGGGGDTAVALQALIEWGPEAFSKFNGMWALVLYDREKHTFLISRDRLGKKPLFYFQDSSQLILSSECKGVLVASGKKFTLDREVVARYLQQALVNDEDNSFFEEIKLIPPGVYTELDLRAPNSKLQFHRYWYHPYENEKFEDSPPTAKHLREALIESVRLRMRSDVPVGILLSGGIDSSSILAAARQIEPTGDIHALSVVSRDPASNEEPFIDLMAKHAKVHVHKVQVDLEPNELLRDLPKVCWFNDQPILGFSDIAHRMLMQKAVEKNLTVLLVGQGSDEQLGGYNKFFYFYLMDCLKKGNLGPMLSMLSGSMREKTILPEFNFANAKRYLPFYRTKKLSYPIGPALEGAELANMGFSESFEKRSWMDLKRFSLPMILHIEDHMSMSWSREIRTPFLDPNVIEILGRVSPSEKLKRGWTKAILREAMEGMIPEEIRWRKDKRGFNVPEEIWIRKDFQEPFTKMFKSDMRIYEMGLVDKKGFKAFHARYKDGDRTIGGRDIFRPYCLETWIKQYESYL